MSHSSSGENDKGPGNVLEAIGLVKRYGKVTALAGTDIGLRPQEILAVIGDNGAGKSTLIKCLSGAVVPDAGQIRLDGEVVEFRSPLDARNRGIETVHQNLAVAPSLDIASNLFLGRERRRPGIAGKIFRILDRKGMQAEATDNLNRLGIMTIQNPKQIVETLSGGQRQAIAVARAAAFDSRIVIMDEPTAALGVRESNAVLDLIERTREHGLSVILISHSMPHVFKIADRIQIQRLGRNVCVTKPGDISMTDAVAIMTGATESAALAS
jgi:fructose transport system ATP-binding protein